MVCLWQVIGFACMATLASSFSVGTVCIAKRRHEAKLHGSHAHIKAWVLDASDHLFLTLGYGKGHPYYYDYIEVKPKSLAMKKVRENEETLYKHINFIQPLDIGWLDIDLYADELYRFNFTSQNVYHELFAESKMRLTKLTVEGSNITVNCNLDTIYWMILKDLTFIPLKPNSINSFSLFSRSDFQPTLTAGNSSIKLGIIGNAINNIKPYKDGYQSPLPRFKEHLVKITCIAYQHCTYILGLDENQKIQEIFSKSYTSLAIHGDGNEFFVKFNKIKPKEVTQSYSTPRLPPAESDDGVMIFFIVLSIVLVIAFPTTVFFIYRILNKQHNEQDKKQKDEIERLMEPKDWQNIHAEQHEKQLKPMGNFPQTSLWNAVFLNRQRLVEHLLDSGKDPVKKVDGFKTSPLEEAHLQGYKGIVKLFANKIDGKQSVPTQHQIESTLKELESRMGGVFQAAKYGQYERNNGINALLNTSSLPGTIRDSNGWSLVHYMAEVKSSNGFPAWQPTDIKNFFEQHVFYINAIDHWGNTPLHFLAQHQGTKDTENQESKDVKWGGQTISVEKAWLQMAELFISHDCDPRIPNHKNKLPHELAKENGNENLTTYLKQKFEDLGKIDHISAADKFEELVDAARNNKFHKIVKLLKEHVPMLPISAERDPLVEAIRNGHPTVVFLLICAGTPLCNCSIDDLTPLEAAHNTLGLPTLFAALMRKVYSERLEAEKSQIPQVDKLHQSLSEGIGNIKSSILENGDNCNWKFESKDEDPSHRSTEAKKLIVAASGLGLSLTVQLLGLENVELMPLPDEESPVDKALSGDNLDTLYVLCRDLKMAPYATHEKSLILKRLEIDLLIAECNIFKKCVKEEEIQLLIGLDKSRIDFFLEEATRIEESAHDWGVYDSDIFYICARFGLIYLLDKYMKFEGKSKIDHEMENYSRSTMLHISVLYGQQHITQYLLHHGASPRKKTIGGYTAAHIAAMVGQRDSMDYILSYMKLKNISTEDVCNFEMTAVQLSKQYEEMRFRSKYPFLDSSDARCIKNEIGESDMAFEILKRKLKELQISDKAQLIKKVEELQCENNDVKIEDIIKETEGFFKDIGCSYKGKLKGFGRYFENNSLFNNEIVEFVLELEAYSAYEDSNNIKIDKRSIGDDIVILKLNKEYEGNINRDNIFMRNFINAIKKRIKEYEPSNKNVNLCPPFLIPYISGVELCWACNSDNEHYRVQTYVDLVIKADLPEINEIKRLPVNIQRFCDNISAELHITNMKGDWTYRGYSLELKIFENLDKNQRIVWLICRFIKLISKQYWWEPTSNNIKIVHRLDENFAGVTVPKERALKALFLNELAENPYQWEKDDIFDRVIGIYRRCLTTDNKVVSVKSLLMPTSYNHNLTESVCGGIRYLESLN